jgi:hypothetical protein
LGVRLCRVGADSHNFDKFRRILPSEGDEGVFQEDDEGAVVAFVNEMFFFGGVREEKGKVSFSFVSFLLSLLSLSLSKAL